MNPFHRWDLQDDSHRQRRMEDRGDDLYVKIEVLEYHDSLCDDDFIKWLEAVKQFFEYKKILDEPKSNW